MSPWRWWSYEPMRPGWLSAFVLLCGTLAFAISLLDAFLQNLDAQQVNRLIWAPEMVGCILFLISGHIAIIEVCHGRFRLIPSSLGWWIVAVNQLGSWLFLLSGLAAFVRPATGDLISVHRGELGDRPGRAVLQCGRHRPALRASGCSDTGARRLRRPPRSGTGVLCHDDGMTDRLSATDASFLYAEDAGTPMHVGGVVDPPPRCRRPGVPVLRHHHAHRVPAGPGAPVPAEGAVTCPGRLARPVWVDDEDFDITYHVRRSALPKPGTDVELDELVGRLISRPLDRTRPLWEVYVIEGLTGGRIALVNKTHHAMVDRIGAVDVAAAILDVKRRSRDLPEQPWIPNPAPSDIDLMVDAVADLTSRPSEALDIVQAGRPGCRRRGDQGARRRGERVRGVAPHGESGPAVAAERRQERAAAVRHRARRPRRPEAGSAGARRIGERCDPDRDHRRVAVLAAVQGGGGDRAHRCPGDAAGVGRCRSG